MGVEAGLTMVRVQSQLRSFEVQPKMAKLGCERSNRLICLLSSVDVPHRDAQHLDQAGSFKFQRVRLGGPTIVSDRRPRTGDAGSDGLGVRFVLRDLKI